MCDQTFTAEVVENARVKSNRSLLITSGPAQGTVCITPTRAAMEATEAYLWFPKTSYVPCRGAAIEVFASPETAKLEHCALSARR